MCAMRFLSYVLLWGGTSSAAITLYLRDKEPNRHHYALSVFSILLLAAALYFWFRSRRYRKGRHLQS